jgi:hypothetical protein
MNIFVLDSNKQKCAEYHNDKHVVKMILESVQILSTVARNNGLNVGYKPTHKNHPCVKWAASSKANWIWLAELTYYLHDEWRHRFHSSDNTQHKSFEVLKSLVRNYNKINIPEVGLTKLAQAMPETYRDNDPIKAYRNYYINEKKHLAKWTNREKPYWY